MPTTDRLCASGGMATAGPTHHMHKPPTACVRVALSTNASVLCKVQGHVCPPHNLEVPQCVVHTCMHALRACIGCILRSHKHDRCVWCGVSYRVPPTTTSRDAFAVPWQQAGCGSILEAGGVGALKHTQSARAEPSPSGSPDGCGSAAAMHGALLAAACCM